MISSMLPASLRQSPQLGKAKKASTGPILPVKAPAVQFAGIHPNAAIGIDSKIAGVTNNAKNTSRLYFKLRNSGQLEKHTYRTEYPLVLIREDKNPEDPNAIAVYSEADRGGIRRKLGYVPRELAQNLAPLMDRGHAFQATLTMIKPYKKNDAWFHSMEMRVEYLAKEGKAPNMKIRKQVEKAFEAAQEAQTYDKVLGLVPEEMHTYRLPDQSRRLMERIDNERGEASYYLKGKLISRVALKPGETPAPEFANEPEVTEPVKARIRKRLDTLA